MPLVPPLIDRLKQLARKAPGTARDLLRQLDEYRGKRTAAPAAPAPPSPAADVVEAPVSKPKPNWELRSQAELIDHLEQHYHAGLRRDLPRLLTAARRVEREHASHPAVPSGLFDALTAFASALEGHMYNEETKLFPMMRTGARGGPIDMPIRMMERDHDDHADELARIRALAGNLEPPADASATWQELYAGLATLETELRQHVYLENHVLFARALGER